MFAQNYSIFYLFQISNFLLSLKSHPTSTFPGFSLHPLIRASDSSGTYIWQVCEILEKTIIQMPIKIVAVREDIHEQIRFYLLLSSEDFGLGIYFWYVLQWIESKAQRLSKHFTILNEVTIKPVYNGTPSTPTNIGYCWQVVVAHFCYYKRSSGRYRQTVVSLGLTVVFFGHLRPWKSSPTKRSN